MHAIEPDIRAVDVACELQGRGITFTDIRPKCAKYFRQQNGSARAQNRNKRDQIVQTIRTLRFGNNAGNL